MCAPQFIEEFIFYGAVNALKLDTHTHTHTISFNSNNNSVGQAMSFHR